MTLQHWKLMWVALIHCAPCSCLLSLGCSLLPFADQVCGWHDHSLAMLSAYLKPHSYPYSASPQRILHSAWPDGLPDSLHCGATSSLTTRSPVAGPVASDLCTSGPSRHFWPLPMCATHSKSGSGEPHPDPSSLPNHEVLPVPCLYPGCLSN